MKTQFARLARSICLALALGAGGAASAASGEATESSLPAQALTPRTLYHFLLAEIAGARGQVGLSAQLYLDLARSTRDPRIARRATEIAMYSRNLGLARNAAQTWSEVAPESEEARRVLAGLSGAGRGEDINLETIQFQLARVLAQSNGRLAQNLLSLGHTLAQVPDKQASRAIINRLTEPYLDVPEAHIARAQAAQTVDDRMGALAAVDRALELRSGWEPAVLLKVQILQQAGATAEALRQLEAETARHPSSRALRVAKARALVSAQRFAEARAVFGQLLEVSPDDAELRYAAGLLSLQLDEPATAEMHLARALAAGHPQPDLIRLHLGQIAADRGEGEAARKWFAEIDSDELRPEATVRSAFSLAREGRVEAARALLQRDADDADIERRYLLAEAQILRDAGRPADALALIDTALRESPDDAGLLYESAMLAERIDRLDLLETRLRRVLELQPDHAHALNALGYSLADRNLRLEEAETLIARAHTLEPADPFILDSLGWVRFRRGDATTALAHLERAYAMRKDAEIAAHLGEVLWSVERREDARRIFAEALAAHPDNQLLKDTAQRLGIQ
jgi:tetratricopeptide (TPR) repeat protein